MKFKKMKSLAISTVIILGMALFVGCDSETGDSTDTSSLEETKAEYIESANEYSYEDMFRNAEENLHKPAVVTGKVYQAEKTEDKDFTLIHMTMIQDGNEVLQDDIMVGFSQEDMDKDPDAVSRFMEGDIITVYGDIFEPMQYDTVMGSERTVPLISAKYIELN